LPTVLLAGPQDDYDRWLAELTEDQSARWHRGEPVLVEHYQDWLNLSAEAISDLVVSEILLRKQQGEQLSLAEYEGRFSHLIDRIKPHLLAELPTDDPARTQHTEITPVKPGYDLPAIPGYEIAGELGRGGMGVVYKARHTLLNRWVALKCINHEAGASQARFLAEAETVARLQHPHIVQLYEIGTVGAQAYLVLELVPGKSLDVRGTPQAPDFAAQTIETLAGAVQYAHDRGVIHRDLKPDNVLMTADGTPKLTDFGLARQLDVDSRKTRAGTVLGTPSYMAPEQAQGHIDQVGPLSDVYSLGATLYELLTGRPPFRGETALDTILLVCAVDVIAPRQLNPQVPVDLETICLKCLEKEPARRYASARALADDLARFRTHQPILARPVGWWERTRKWAKRKPSAAAAVALAVLAGLLAVVGVGLFALFQAQRSQFLEQELAERARTQLAVQRADEQLQLGTAAADQGNWDDARLHATNALEALGRTPSALRGPAQTLAEHAQTQIAARQRQREFNRQLEEALFAAAELTGQTAAEARQLTQTAAAAALQAVAGATLAAEQRLPCQVLALLLADLAPDAPTALAHLDQAERFGPATRFGALCRVRWLRQSGAPAADIAAAQRVVDVLPATQAGDHFLLGRQAGLRGDLATAATELQLALQQQPDQAWIEFYLSVTELRLFRHEAARGHLTEYLARHKQSAWGWLLRGLCAYGLGAAHFAAAEADFATAEKLGLNPLAQHCLLTNRGALRLERQQIDAAIADFEAARALLPHDPAAYLNLGRISEAKKDWPAAVRAYSDGLARGQAGTPAQVKLLRARANALLLLGQMELARADWAEVQRLDPHPADVQIAAGDRLALGLALDRLGQSAAAAEQAAAALRLVPKLALAHRLRADTLLKAGQPTAALAALDEYLTDNPADAAAFRARGIVRARMGRPTEALADYTRAIDIKPEPETHLLRGWAYLLLHDAPKLALADFNAVLELSPTHGEAFAGRGMTRLRLNQVQAALDDAESALRQGTATARLRYHAARIFAIAAQTPTAGMNAEAWTQRAAQLIEQAVEQEPEAQRGVFWREVVQVDPQLQAVRTQANLAPMQKKYAK
jgi:tetratricopeptide (TPR) repeat protein/tRNA A-37 threonylcarbamoyl transferase component Bud32